MGEMRDEGHDCFLFWFCGVGCENLSADRDGEHDGRDVFFLRHAQDGREPGARYIEVKTSDGQTSDVRWLLSFSASSCCYLSFVYRKS